jgi:DNA-binding SARP family transcriptional activator
VRDAEAADRAWWARLGCALLEADAGNLTTLDLIKAQADQEEDLWGAGLIQLLQGIVTRKAETLDAAAALFVRVDASVLQLWANCMAAMVAGEARPYRMQQVRTACRALNACGVMGAAQQWASQFAGTAVPSPLQRTPLRLQLRVLGGFELIVGGMSVDQSVVRPRARRALHLLALHVGHPVHRDVLVQAVWPDSRLDAGYRSVHVAISSLRHLLEPDAKRGQSILLPRLGDSDSLGLPDGSSCDLLDFEEALASARTARLSGDLPAERSSLHRALACYGGDLLPEDGSAEWVVGERERLRLAAADAGERLARAEAAVGNVGAAVEQVRRTLAFDTYRDTAWQLLVQLHEKTGDLSAAHAVRQQHHKVLAELGLT